MANKKLNADKVDYIAVHCAATTPSMDIGKYEIDRWHRERNFLKIGYHAVIRRDGKIEWGREKDEIGAHVRGFNSRSIGICLAGGIDDNGNAENNFTPMQFKALEYVINYFLQYYPDAKVQGHRDFPRVAKECPSFDAITWWEELSI